MRAGLFRRLWRLATDDDGPTTAEYAMMLGLILGAIILAVAGLGLASQESLQNSANMVAKAAGH